MSQFSGNFPDTRTHGKGSIYRTLPPKEVGPKSVCVCVKAAGGEGGLIRVISNVQFVLPISMKIPADPCHLSISCSFA